MSRIAWPIPVSKVSVPSDMIGIGDAHEFWPDAKMNGTIRIMILVIRLSNASDDGRIMSSWKMKKGDSSSV
jgi:hypothetical protein